LVKSNKNYIVLITYAVLLYLTVSNIGLIRYYPTDDKQQAQRKRD